jgi:glycine cleavage system H protein
MVRDEGDKAQKFAVPEDRLYTGTHEWLKNGICFVGITDFFTHKILPVKVLILPEHYSEVKKGEAIAVIESSKTIQEVCAPISGKVLAVNEKVKNKPNLVIADPYGEGWIIALQIKDVSELKDLLTPEKYINLIFNSNKLLPRV